MKTNLVFILGITCVMFSMSEALSQATSTQERARWVEITRKLEMDPLDEALSRQGDATIKEIENDHSIVVGLCPDVLYEFNGMKYTCSRTMTRQFMLATTAFKIENPDKADDSRRENRRDHDLAALQSVLKASRSILKAKPDAHQKSLDDLLAQEIAGKLPEYVKKKCP